MTHDDCIDRAVRRLIDARSMERSARATTTPDSPIDWPRVAQVERQQAAAFLRLLIDVRKASNK